MLCNVAFADLCLVNLWDSLKAIPASQLATSPNYVTFYRADDSIKNTVRPLPNCIYQDGKFKCSYSIVPCDSFWFTYDIVYKTSSSREFEGYTWFYKKISETSYYISCSIYHSSSNSFTNFPNDTVSILSPAIERISAINQETIINITVFNIQGKLLGDLNYLKINRLHGFYIFKYVTDKRTYFSKRIFN